MTKKTLKKKRVKKFVTVRQLELSFRLHIQIRMLVQKKIGMDTFKIRAFFEENALLRDWYRLSKRGNNPQYHTLCDIADALEVPIADLLKFDESENFIKLDSYPYLISSKDVRWKKYKSQGKLPWE